MCESQTEPLRYERRSEHAVLPARIKVWRLDRLIRSDFWLVCWVRSRLVLPAQVPFSSGGVGSSWREFGALE